MDWSKPRTGTTRADIAFGPKNLREWLPEWESIPDSFKRGHRPYCEVTSMWFFNGLPNGLLVSKDGISERDALAHLKTILMSFEPKHEHKEAGVAYLMSLWFEEPNLKGIADATR